MEIFWHNWLDSQPHTTSERVSQLSVIIEDFNTVNRRRQKIFMWKPKLKKTTGRMERIHYSIPRFNGFVEYYHLYNFLDPLFASMDIVARINTLWLCNWCVNISDLCNRIIYMLWFLIISQIIVSVAEIDIQRYLPLSITHPTEIGVLKHLEHGDNLTA